MPTTSLYKSTRSLSVLELVERAFRIPTTHASASSCPWQWTLPDALLSPLTSPLPDRRKPSKITHSRSKRELSSQWVPSLRYSIRFSVASTMSRSSRGRAFASPRTKRCSYVASTHEFVRSLYWQCNRVAMLPIPRTLQCTRRGVSDLGIAAQFNHWQTVSHRGGCAIWYDCSWALHCDLYIRRWWPWDSSHLRVVLRYCQRLVDDVLSGLGYDAFNNTLALALLYCWRSTIYIWALATREIISMMGCIQKRVTAMHWRDTIMIIRKTPLGHSLSPGSYKK